jgi:hypothetical protein
MDNFGSNIGGGLVIFAVVVIVIFLVCREIICWYWKINQNVALLTEIRDLLLAAKGGSQGGVAPVAQQSQPSVGPSGGTESTRSTSNAESYRGFVKKLSLLGLSTEDIAAQLRDRGLDAAEAMTLAKKR